MIDAVPHARIMFEASASPAWVSRYSEEGPYLIIFKDRRTAFILNWNAAKFFSHYYKPGFIWFMLQIKISQCAYKNDNTRHYSRASYANFHKYAFYASLLPSHSWNYINYNYIHITGVLCLKRVSSTPWNILQHRHTHYILMWFKYNRYLRYYQNTYFTEYRCPWLSQ